MDLRKISNDLHTELNAVLADRDKWASTQRDLISKGLITDLGAREEMARGDRANHWTERTATVRRR